MSGDFNGDGFDDLLWRRADGSISVWESLGYDFNRTSNTWNHVGLDWQITAVGDFNGDDCADILWRNVDGRLTNWLGAEVGGFSDNLANAYTSVATDWQVTAVGDFNGDGRDDILWRNVDGRLTNWLGTEAGGFSDNVANAYNSVAPDWQVAGVGDFNGDSRDDILWRNSDGRMTNWLGTASGGFSDNVANAYNNVSPDWQIAGIGDFNGDGRSDIFWQNDTNPNSLRMSNWLGAETGGFVDNVSNSYVWSTAVRAADFGDFNGDGRDDLVWRLDFLAGASQIGVEVSTANGGLDWAGAAFQFYWSYDIPTEWVLQRSYASSGIGEWDY